MRRDLARERLQTIRSLQGWREAYKVAGLTSKGSDDTKRRRLSRLINRKTSGAKKLEPKQRRKINQTFKTKTRQKALNKGRTDQEIKAINKIRREARKRARSIFGPKGTFPDPAKLKVRLESSEPLTKEEIERIRKGFESADKDEGRVIRAEYKTLLTRVKITNLPPRQRPDFKRKVVKATRAVERDEKKMREKVR